MTTKKPDRDDTRDELEDDLERDRVGSLDGPDDPIWNSEAEQWRNGWTTR
jgi:hypothetical protein